VARGKERCGWGGVVVGTKKPLRQFLSGEVREIDVLKGYAQSTPSIEPVLANCSCIRNTFERVCGVWPLPVSSR
jgi:hypothetical protein